MSTESQGARWLRHGWRSLAIAVAVVVAVGLGPVAEAAKKDAPPGAATSTAAKEKAKGPKDKGPKKNGPFVTVSGMVTNSLSGDAVAGGNVTFTAGTVSFSTLTDGNGMYSEKLPVSVSGPYEVLFAAPLFNDQSTSVVLVKGNPVTLDVALVPIAPVIVNAEVAGDASPEGMLAAMGSWKIMDGSSFVSATWSQGEGAGAGILPGPVMPGDEGAANADVTLAGAGAYKHELIEILTAPPVTQDQLPPNVEVPEGEFVGGMQEQRYQVVAINHFALERAGHVALTFEVVTTSGAYPVAVDVHTELAFEVNAGLRNVAVNIPVLLNGDAAQGAWAWSLASQPAGSAAQLMDADSQNPSFVPDLAGIYEVMESNSGAMLKIHAGTWRGVIVGQDENGRPVSDPGCTGCHSGGFAPDTFTPWAQTGHAERFTDQLNGPFYSPSCFGCHTVGFDTDADAVNGGFDDAADYDAFLVSGLLGPNDPLACPDGDWACMLEGFPASAKLANIQCENCHGPQSGPLGSFSTSHGGGVLQPDEARVSLSSDVCAQCHGEPLRHARFQQWQLSRHSNYEVAIDESGSGNCSRCHTANGFLAWLPVLLDDDPLTDPTASISVTWTEDEAHPQTCVTCHDPHNIGTTSGNDTNAVIRVSGDTPPLVAGFQAFGVGKGAMCMTCHNTRRGLRNDATWATTTDRDRAPHGGVQADLIMGQNAYFVTVGIRGAHSFISDTCVTCHMKETPPPDVLAYNQGGSNHTFFASEEVCIECHTGGEPNAAGIQAAVGGPLHELEGLITDYYAALLASLLASGDQIDLDGDALLTDPAQVLGVHLGEFRGRQALIIDLASGSVGPVRLTTIDIVAGPDIGTTLFDQVSETVLQSTWNYQLVHTDRSGGVHNPAFSSLVLERAIAEMSAP
jgi:hypothetical protein